MVCCVTSTLLGEFCHDGGIGEVEVVVGLVPLDVVVVVVVDYDSDGVVLDAVVVGVVGVGIVPTILPLLRRFVVGIVVGIVIGVGEGPRVLLDVVDTHRAVRGDPLVEFGVVCPFRAASGGELSAYVGCPIGGEDGGNNGTDSGGGEGEGAAGGGLVVIVVQIPVHRIGCVDSRPFFL